MWARRRTQQEEDVWRLGAVSETVGVEREHATAGIRRQPPVHAPSVRDLDRPARGDEFITKNELSQSRGRSLAGIEPGEDGGAVAYEQFTNELRIAGALRYNGAAGGQCNEVEHGR